MAPMHVKTPLSTRAKPYIPAGSKQDQTVGAQIVGWLPIIMANAGESESPAVAQRAQDSPCPKGIKASKVARGRSDSREDSSRMPSRTPSPSGHSVCLSEVSTSFVSC